VLQGVVTGEDERAANQLDSGNRAFSLWDAKRPKRLVRAPGLGVLNQRLPGRVAALCAGKFLGRNHGAVRNAKPTNDD
jgi:hypothetical protein